MDIANHYSAFVYVIDRYIQGYNSLVTPYGVLDLGMIGLGSLLPDGTELLAETVLTYHHRCSVAFIWEQFQVIKTLIHKTSLKIMILKLEPHLPGSNEWKFSQYHGMSTVVGCYCRLEIIQIDKL